MASLLYRLGRAAYRGRRLVLAIWAVLLAALVGAVLAFGGTMDDEFTIPGSESQKALDEMAETFPDAAGTSAQIVFTAPDGEKVTDPKYAAAITAVLKEAEGAPQVTAVVSPFDAKTITRDQGTALAQVQYGTDVPGLREGTLDALEKTPAAAEKAGLETHVGGLAYAEKSVPVSAKEGIGVLVALVVLGVTFGSLLAAGMPLLTALVGVGAGMAGLMALTDVVTVSSSAPTLALMLGLAVGIDYALFILSRHRSQLARGMDPEESTGVATGTAGSAVIFAGLTVVIALAGLTVVRIPFLTVMGLAAAGTVAVAVVVAITLLPALLGFAGNRLAPRSGSRADRREQAAAAAHADDAPAGNFGERWAQLVTAKPLLTVLAVVAALVAVAVPARDLQLALPDNGSAAAGSNERETYDLVSEKFGPGFNGPLVLFADISAVPAGKDGQGVQKALQAIVVDLNKTDGVVGAAPQQIDPKKGKAVVTVVPETGPSDERTKDLVHEIRDRAGQWEDETRVTFAVTGATAVAIDVSERLDESLLPFLLVVVGLSLVLLLLVFRSLVVPVKATLGFLLSVAASFGAVVAVFQWGWLADALGVTATGPVISFLPIILIGVLFGLAMDYEVFLVSRMREAYMHDRHPLRAVHTGARYASRVVTAAALIMFAVFASFVLADDAIIKSMAFGLALGVLVDAFVVRMTLVPAVLALVGKAAWWLPGWLDRLLPDLDIEGEKLTRTAAAEHTAEPQGDRTAAEADLAKKG
ncbi:MMPL family transporter [Streptomyces sp. NPDC059637]|uniref:MMPL family transporter n=1 Tax=Streptomyces sp. NPDC059637 TaxID=3347752 RepID=UPI0036C7F0C1